MSGLAIVDALCDLLTTGKAIGQHNLVRPGGAHRGQEHALAERVRELELVLLEPERPSHAAATAVEAF